MQEVAHCEAAHSSRGISFCSILNVATQCYILCNLLFFFCDIKVALLLQIMLHFATLYATNVLRLSLHNELHSLLHNPSARQNAVISRPVIATYFATRLLPDCCINATQYYIAQLHNVLHTLLHNWLHKLLHRLLHSVLHYLLHRLLHSMLHYLLHKFVCARQIRQFPDQIFAT
jgi:hypothetical protein